MKRFWAAILVACSLLASQSSLAIRPDEVLADPVLEERAREIGKQLRCLVCQNQSIDDSDADLARDLRILVRERLQQGDTDDEVLAYMKARYGDFVLLKPPMGPVTYLLWFGPALLGVAGIVAVVFFFRRNRERPDEPTLTDAERRRIAEVIGDRPEAGGT